MGKISSHSIYNCGPTNHEIPLGRYLLSVGGVLLALLYAADAIMPRPQTTPTINSEPTLPRIRIHSELKGPEAVVLDTSGPTLVPLGLAQQDAAAEPENTVTLRDPNVDERVALPIFVSPNQIFTGEKTKVEPKPERRSKVGRSHSRRRPVFYAERRDIGIFSPIFVQNDPRIRDSLAQIASRPTKQVGARPEVWARSKYTRRPHLMWFDTGW